MRDVLVSRLACAVLVAAVANCGSLFAADEAKTLPAPAAPAAPAGALTLTTERVVVYKDGYGLMIKNATATADAEGKVYTQQVPDSAVLGSFWALAEQKVLGMRAEYEETKGTRKKNVTCLNVRELLRANLGKKVTVLVDDGKDNKRAVSGTAMQVLEEAVSAKDPVVRPMGLSSGRTVMLELPPEKSAFEELRESGVTLAGSNVERTLVRDLSPRGGEFVEIDGSDGKTVLPISRIVSVTGVELVTTTTREEEVVTQTKKLVIDMGKENAGKAVNLKLMYFSPGIRWIPTYRISGQLKDKAEVALQGEVVNELEDIKGAAVDLVVGVPNFKFKEAVSPLTLEKTMRATLVNISDGNRIMLNSITNQAQVQFRNGNYENDVMRRGAGALPAELAGGEQDLFVYPLAELSLKRGGSAAIPLWQQTAELRHLYTYDVKARRNRSTGGMIKTYQQQDGGRGSPLQLTLNSIWHQLELTNGGKVPWTTGAALMMKEQLPLGQDLLTYTPPTSTACVPVTVAVDLRGSTDEEEVDRTNSALKVDGYEYALVKKKGTITVNSFRTEKSVMRITLSTGGKVLTASDEGNVKINDFSVEDWDDASYMRPNNHSDVTWEFTIEPGKSKTLNYVVSSYVR